MKSKMSSIGKLACCLATLIMGFCFGASAWAQAPPGAGAPANNNPRSAERGRQADESRLRSAEMDAVAESEQKKRVQIAIVHLKEDFTRIQLLRNDIARDLVARKPLNYRLVSEQVGEINKRANRMNASLWARSPDVKEQDSPADLPGDQMVSALVKLCKLVDSFTENPALKNAETVDAKEIDKAREDKARADKDLLAIIKLSESIRKKAESLKTPE